MKSAVFSPVLATRARQCTGLLVALGALLLVSLPAAAIPIEFSFSGVITEKLIARRTPLGDAVRLVPAERPLDIPVGTVFSGSYVFELVQPDLFPGGTSLFEPEEFGFYTFTSGQIRIGAYQAELFPAAALPPESAPIIIANGFLGFQGYQFSARVSEPLVTGYELGSLSFTLDYPLGSDILSEQAPLVSSRFLSLPFSLSSPGGRDGELDDLRVQGRFTSFSSARVSSVAAPPTPVLLAVAILLMLHSKHRRSWLRWRWHAVARSRSAQAVAGTGECPKLSAADTAPRALRPFDSIEDEKYEHLG